MNTMPSRVITFATGCAIAFAARTAAAQRPRGADSISDAAVAESLAVQKGLVRFLGSRTMDTAAWHHLGAVTWALWRRAQAANPPHGLDATRLGRMADTSLRLAAYYAPHDVGYRLDVGRYLLDSKVALTRSGARGHFEKALREARATGTPASHAEAALEDARTYWWRYDVMKNRRMPVGDASPPRSVSDGLQPMARTADAMDQLARAMQAADILSLQTGPLDPHVGLSAAQMSPTRFSISQLTGQQIDAALTGVPQDLSYSMLPQNYFTDVRRVIESTTQDLPEDAQGEISFVHATDLFTEAYAADPGYPGTFRALAMVYADRSMWQKLESFSREHVERFPHDSLGWMALGLALHRQDRDPGARVAFDSALALLGPTERAHLDDWRRVLAPHTDETRRVLADESPPPGAKERLYWMLSNPVWADTTAPTRIEFLARVAYAELRWTIEEFGLSGADTDRGDIFVRYGPPDTTVVVGPRSADNANDITTFWLYRSGLIFAFSGMPTFGTAHTAYGDDAMVERLRQAQPVRWDNVATVAVDSLPAQVVRFRAGTDSVDVLVAARLEPPDSIAHSMSIAARVQRYFWIVAPGAFRQYSDAGPVDTAGVYSWARRIFPNTYLYRVEEFGETGLRAGRATAAFDASTSDFPLHGFGVSDLLIATGASAADATNARWRELGARPAAGTVPHGSDLGILWENYDLAAKDGAAEYDATLTLRRTNSGRGRVAMRIGGVVASIAKLETSDANHVSYKFSRSVAPSPAFADYVTLSLGDTPAGQYVLTLELTDRVSGKTATRTTTFAIRE